MNSAIFSLILLASATLIYAQFDVEVVCGSAEDCKNIFSLTDANCVEGHCMCRNPQTNDVEICKLHNSRTEAKPYTIAPEIMVQAPAPIRIACANSAECEGKISKSECQSGYCVCKNTDVLSGDKKSCLNLALKMNDECVENIQCAKLEGTECFEKQCKCERKKYHAAADAAGEKCFLNIAHGRTCNAEDDHCYELSQQDGNNTLACEENICKCKQNYAYVADRCELSGGTKMEMDIIQFALLSVLTLLSTRVLY